MHGMQRLAPNPGHNIAGSKCFALNPKERKNYPKQWFSSLDVNIDSLQVILILHSKKKVMSESVTSNNKRIMKNTFILYVRMFFIMLLTLYISRIVLQVLGVEDFGIYNVVGGVVTMMGVLKGAMSTATTRFITFELGRSDFEQLRKTYCVSMMIYALLSIVFVLLAETIGVWFLNTQLTIPEIRMYAVNWVYQFTILSVVVEMMSQPYNAVIIAHEKMSFFAIVSVLEISLKLLFVFSLKVISADTLIVYGFLMMLTTIIIRIVYSIYCKKQFLECNFRVYKDVELFKRILSYSGWNLFGSASTIIKGQGLNILLNMFFNPAVNAARGIAYQINGAVSQFSHNFYTAVRPQITKYYAQDDLTNMFKLVFRSGKMLFYLNLLLGLPLVVETPYIINLWLGQVPEYAIVFSRLIIVISMVDAMSHPLMTSIQATGSVAVYQSVVGTLNILNLPISYVFLKLGYPPLTVFHISLIITVVSVFVRLVIVKHYISSFPFTEYALKVFGICLLVSIVSVVIPIILHIYLNQTLYNVLCICLACLISVIITVYLIGMNKDERLFVINIVASKLKIK